MIRTPEPARSLALLVSAAALSLAACGLPPDDASLPPTTAGVGTGAPTTAVTDLSPGVATTTAGESIELIFARGIGISSLGDLLLHREGEFIAATDGRLLEREFVDLNAEAPSVTITSGVVSGGPDFPDPYLRAVTVRQSHAAQAIAEGSADTGGQAVTFDIPVLKDPILVEMGLPYPIRERVTMDTDSWAILEVVSYLSDGAVVADSEATPVAYDRTTRSNLHPSDSEGAGFAMTRFDGGFESRQNLVGLGFAVFDLEWLPAGFSVSSYAFASKPLSYVDGAHDVAVVAFASGTAAITMTLRPADDSSVADPSNPYGDLPSDDVYTYAAAGGVFSIAPPGYQVCHAWGVVDGTLITLSGAFSTTDAEMMLDSIRPAAGI